MKKLIALALAVFMVFSLCACSGGVDTAVLEDILEAVKSLQASVDALAGGEAAAPAEEAPAEEAAEPAPAGDGKVYYVHIVYSFPEVSGDGAKKAMADVEEASGGRIQFDVDWQFGTYSPLEICSLLEKNEIDMATFNPAEHPAEMPLNGKLVCLPLLNYPGWEASTKIYLNLLFNNDAMMAEYTDNGMLFYAGYMMPGYQIYSTKEITDTTPALFDGLRVMVDQPQMNEFINANNGAASRVDVTDYTMNLSGGNQDTLVQHVNCAFAFQTFEYFKSAVFFGEGGFYSQPCVYGMSQTFWDSLPEDLQEIFMDYAAEFCYESQKADEALYDNAAYPSLAENADIIVLDDEEIAEWQDAIAPIVDAAVDEITADSPTAPEVLATLKDMIANYDADTFEIGANNFGREVIWAEQ